MLDDEYRLLARLLGFSATDAHRAAREDGPFDIHIITTRCNQCGARVEQTLRDFTVKCGRCACGGFLDETPLLEFARRVLSGDSSLPPGVRKKPTEDGSHPGQP